MSPLEDVYVIGVGMHRFGSTLPVKDTAYAAGSAAMHDAGIGFDAIDTVYNGYRYADPMVDGIAIVKQFGLTGAPIMQVENASATGSSAFRLAVADVASGRAEVAMALGVGAQSRQPLPPPGEASTMGTAPPASAASVEGFLLPAAFFAMWAVRRMHDVGTTEETFATIAAKNWNHARLNPFAARQSDHMITPEEVLASTMISYPHTSMMSAATGGGAACALVANGNVARAIADQTGRPLVRVLASRMASEQYVAGHIFAGAIVGPPDLTRTTGLAAYEEAGVGPEDLDLVQVHDAFPVEELLYAELLGICGDGEADKLVAEGATRLGGRIPFSTDGGLIARGHAMGPTGLAQIWELTQQLRGEAGPRQVAGARTGLAHLIGAGSVCIIHILQQE